MQLDDLELMKTLRWLASTFQSIYGTPLAFRALQSAAMGGWNAAIVNGIVQGGAMVVAGISALFKSKQSEMIKEKEDGNKSAELS